MCVCVCVLRCLSIFLAQPSDDQYAVSREELVIALRKCLTASHKFAEVGVYNRCGSCSLAVWLSASIYSSVSH